MEAIILAGGLGTRLRSVCSDLPKPQVDVHGKPFLAHLMSYWKAQGITHFILSVGYLHEKIIAYFGSSFEGVPIDYAIEQTPLGTGGGLLLAIDDLWDKKSPVFVVNGDTYFEVPGQEFLQFHMEKKSRCSFALYSIENNTRYGGLEIHSSGQIIGMRRVSQMQPCLINGGCYLIQPETFQSLKSQQGTDQKVSLEEQLLPFLIAEGSCYGKIFNQFFIDIGIPEDYQSFLARCRTTCSHV